MTFDFVSLVPAGDDPEARVVIAKSAHAADHVEDRMPQSISKADLDPQVAAYITGLEGEVDTLSSQIEKAEEDIQEREEQIASLKETLSKAAPGTPEGEKAIEDALLEKADPALRAFIEKSRAEAREAQEIAKAERDARLDTVYIAKAAALPHVGQDPSTFGPLLRRVHETLSKEDAEALDQILKAADAQIAEGSLFKTFGNGGATVTSTQVESLAADIRKTDPTMSREQAIAKAYEANPDLFTQDMLAATGQEG